MYLLIVINSILLLQEKDLNKSVTRQELSTDHQLKK